MRRLALVALCALLTACTATPTTPAASPQASVSTVPAERASELQRLSISLTEDMERGQFATTVQHAGDSIKDKVSEAVLKSAFEKVTPLAGAYQETIGAFIAAMPAGDVVYVVAKHEKKPLRVLFSFEPGTTKLNGLNLNVATEAEVAQASGSPSPTPTFPPTGVNSTDAAVTVGAHRLPGVLVTPAKAEKRPIAVLFLWGSGPQDRDETIGAAGNKPFRDLADSLAAQGITSLRFDKRTKVAPESFTTQSTLEDEYFADARAAVELLRARPELAGYRIFVVGHSLGAMVLPTVLQADPGLAGGVSLAGSPRSLFDIIQDQSVAAVNASSQTEAEKKAANERSGKVSAALKAMTDASAAVPAEVAGVYAAPYVVSLNRLNQAEVAKKLTVPLLFCQGEADQQVYPKADFAAWKTTLAGRPNVTFRSYPGLNHLFMQTTGASVPEDYDAAARVSPAVSADVASWLIAHAG